jgi:hypothetical protein
MIKELTFYTVSCDNCNEYFSTDDYSGWVTEANAVEEAYESGWEYVDGKHYCDKCHRYDESDNLIIDELRKKS